MISPAPDVAAFCHAHSHAIMCTQHADNFPVGWMIAGAVVGLVLGVINCIVELRRERGR